MRSAGRGRIFARSTDSHGGCRAQRRTPGLPAAARPFSLTRLVLAPALRRVAMANAPLKNVRADRRFAAMAKVLSIYVELIGPTC